MEQTIAWTRQQFRRFFGYPEVAVCPKCGGPGNHLMKGGGFYCQLNYESTESTVQPTSGESTTLLRQEDGDGQASQGHASIPKTEEA